MSIDARIRDVIETEQGEYLLCLEPRRGKSGWSLMGQKELLIESPTWKPGYGMAVWGGDPTVIIETGTEQKCYKRQGYTRLKENFRTQ